MQPGCHAFHLHVNPITDEYCSTAGDHYNPFNKPHGPPSSDERHVGDIGNICADDQGKGVLELTDRLV